MIRVTKSVLVLALAGAIFTALPSVCEADGFTITAPLTGHAVTSCSDITMSGGSIDSAGVNATPPTNKGEVLTNGNITLSGSSTINGDAVIGPAKHVTTSGTAHITGTTTVATSTFNCQPVDMVALKNLVSVTNDNAHVPQTTNHHNALVGTNFTMSGTDSITLAAGTYYFTNVAISGSSVITLSGPVHIFVNGSVSISGGSIVSSNGYGLHFWLNGTSFALSSSTFKAYIYAPSAAASLSSSTLSGGIFANTISISGTSHVTRAIDDDPPHVAITSPANNSVPSDLTHVVVTGTVSDAETDVSVSVNGHPATIAADGTWQVTLNVSGSPSPIAITAVATDAAGNSTAATINVLAVTAPPVISLTSPAPNSTIATRLTNLSGSAGTSTSLTVNGTAATISAGNWSLNGFDLGNDGLHTLTIKGTVAGVTATITPAITNDTTQPTIVATVSPSPNAAGWNTSTATVTFACSDVTSGIATCPAAVTVSAETSGQTVSGTATDKAGNQKSASVVVKLDETAPLVSITAPATGTTVTSATLTVSGTVSDSRSGVAGVTCNGGTATLSGTTFTCGVTLAQGDNILTVIATDVAGNAATPVTRHVTYTPDTTAPFITITSPANNSFTKLTTVNVSGTATDDVAVANVTVNGSPATLTGSTWTSTATLTAPDGAKTITAIATDSSGNHTPATAQITLDTTAPVVAITSPADGTTVRAQTLTVSGTVSDATSGVNGVTCNGVAASVTGNAYTCSVTLSIGINAVSVVATDKVGNASSPVVIHTTFTPDTTAPVVTIASPAAGTFTNQTTVTVSGTATDDISVATVTVNGAVVPLSGNAWTTTVTLTSAEGPQTITAIATDGSGNSTPATVVITLDTTPPVIAITSPADQSSGTSATLSVAGSVNDTSSGVASVTFNGVNGAFASGTFTCTVPLIVGDNPITAVATDKAGNTNSTSIHATYTPDTQAPVITITSPAAGTFTKQTAVTVSGVATDDVAVTKVTVEGVQVPFASNGTWTTTVNLSGPDGAKTITAVATDGTNKSTTAQVQIVLDTTPPVVAITAPADHGTGTDSSITVSGTVSDATSGVSGVTCSGGVAATLSGGTFSCHVTLATGDNLITATATDNAGNSADATPIHFVYTPDTQAPTIAFTSPADGTITDNPTVTVTGTANDDVAVASVTVNGVSVPFAGGTWTATVTLTKEGSNPITAVATDGTGKSTTATIQITLDTTAPTVAIASPADGATLANPALTITGTVSDAGSGIDSATGMTCNGIAATITGGTFTCNVTLAEGSNTIAIVATDKAGNRATPSLTVQLDTRAPQVVVSAPVANVCVSTTSLQVIGQATDPHLGAVTLSITPGTGSVNVTPAADGSFSGTLPLGADGKYVVSVQAADTAGHTAVATIPLTVDRTQPAIEITSGGAAFTGGAFNHAISINVRGVDADPAVSVTTTLGGTAYVPGTPVSTEGQYVLNVTALDCAGNTQQASVSFKIDMTPPQITGLTPATGATVASATTAITGSVDADDVKSLIVDGTAIAATFTGRNFTISPSLAEGTNNLVLVATDDAGNSTRKSYSITVKTTTPSVQILDNGVPIATNALFNRNVTPVITSNDPNATITATLDTLSFTSGTVVSAETPVPHTLVAHAADSYGHSSDATVTFTIDKTPPVLTISAPADGATIATTTVDVSGSAGDAVRVTVNGAPATPGTAGAFTATVPLDLGTTPIVVTAFDAAGNSASATRTVSRADARPGLVLTSPADGTITNHTTTTVAGQVLTPSLGAHVTVNGTDITPDAAGAFRIDGFALHDGENDIIASITGSSKSVTVKVISDVIPPTLKVFANGVEMQPAARFTTSPAITLQANDNNPAGLTTTLTIDGTTVSGASPALADGGHVLTAIATDAAHNQTRLDLTFSVGSSASATSACTLSGFDPPEHATAFSSSITFSGHTGGAATVFVNNKQVTAAEGSFATSLQLTSEGANPITISCADASGNPVTDGAVSMTIYRYTNAPSISITAPTDKSVLSAATVAVTGTVSADVVSGDVNGIAFTPTGGTFSVPNVALVTGLNVITARGRNAAQSVGIATVRVIVANGAPSITLTSPLPATTTSATTIDVSGTWKNIDPATLRVNGVTPTPKATTDTTGTFLANVSINPNATTTITVSGQNGAGTQVSASVDVQNTAGPAISITAPADNTWYGATATAPDAITGTISGAAPASTVSVNGVNAPLTGNQFSASIPFADGTTVTTVLARVTTPDNVSSTDSIRLIKMPGALSVLSSFPAAGATAIDPGALIVLLFSNPLDGTTKSGAVTLTDDAGHTITGFTFVDNDALSFAPDVPLASGHQYTVTVSQTLQDRAGQTLAAPFVVTFSTASGASGIAPAVTSTGALQGCLSTVTISGTASAVGARVRLTIDGVSTSATASADKTFTFTAGLSGQPGFHVARIQEVGADGTLSPETDVTYEINCGGPSGPVVTGATLDRNAKTLTVQFSKAMNPATLTASPAGTIQLASGTTVLAGTVAMNATNDTATVTYGADVSPSLTLTVTTGAQDATGAALASSYTQSFPSAAQALGNGYITGGVFDGTTGRPLAGASVTITPSANGTTTTDGNGRYTMASLGEGAFTIQASAAGFTTVWRQVVVPAGSGVVPIDIRLTKRGTPQNGGADLPLQHGGDTPVTKVVQLFVPAAALTSSTSVSLTACGGQSLAGLLPLGWSPLASAEISLNASSIPAPLSASRLTFVLTAADGDAITAASQTLSVVQYDSTRDEWRTVVAAATVATGTDPATRIVTADIQTSGNYALVYPDTGGPSIAVPEPAHTGTALQGVPNPCGGTPSVCVPTSKGFNIDPPSVAPTGRATATLITDGTDKSYPSGTAVQAFIDEQLNLANGTVSNGAPFATDLLLYRAPSGATATALFHVAPSSDAASAVLRDGVDHVRIVDYPGRIDRGTLIGSEGGRVPGDDTISITLPEGATTDALHATVVPMTATDVQGFGTVPGFHIAGGFTLSLSDPTAPAVDLNGDGIPDVVPVTLLKPAQGTFTIDLTKFATANRQVVLAEVIDKSSFGAMVRLANTTTAVTTPAPGVVVVTTDAIDPTKLPVDGIVHDGRYLLLTADSDVAFAWGQVRLGSATGAAVSNALITAGIGSTFSTPLGVADLTRTGGTFALPVAAGTSTPYALKPRSVITGDGDPTVAPATPVKNDKVAFGTLVLAPKPLQLVSITPNNAEVSTSGFQAVAQFNIAVDRNSVAGKMIVTNVTTSTVVAGTLSGDGGVNVTFTPAQPLASGSTYTIVVQPGILSTGGAPLALGGSATFTTPALPPANLNIDPTKIQITIPADGVSVIRGTAGALPVGDVALAVRRNQYFIGQYQKQVGSDGTTDGSFSFNAGGSGADRITTSDLIDLWIQDKASGSTVAILPLTPFVTTDGLGFIAPVGQTITFTSAPPLSASITVPAGAFTTPTLVTVAPAAQSVFQTVPSFDAELGFHGAFTLTFDGTANKPLDITIPAPAGTDPNKLYVLGRLGDSTRGPRIEIDDLVSVVNGHFTTVSQGTSSGQRVTRSMSVVPNNTDVGGDARSYMIKAIKTGQYAVTDILEATPSAVGWAAISGLQSDLDLFWDAFNSLYVSEFYLVAGHGRVVIPVLTSTPFTVQGDDAATGIQLFQHKYDPIPPVASGQVTGIPSLATNTTGPYPVFGDPFSIQTVEIAGGIDELDSVNGVKIDTSVINKSGQGRVVASFTTSGDPTAAPRHLRIYDVRSGELSDDGTSQATINNALPGDKLVIYSQSDRIDPRSELAIVFNEAIQLPFDPNAKPAPAQATVDAALRPLFTLWKNTVDSSVGAPNWVEVSPQTSFSVDSGGRRVLIQTSLQSGAEYRIHIDPSITDVDSAPLPMLSVPGTPSAAKDGLDLYFAVRKPAGALSPFKLVQGNIRDLALDGNLLFVSAQSGGLFAYDVSDPASLKNNGPEYGWAPAVDGESWSVAVDNHGRVWTTALLGDFGVIRSYRTEDFIDNFSTGAVGSQPPVNIRGSGAVSWRPGITVGIDDGVDTTLLSDRPEATPRKLQVVTQDDSFVITAGNDFAQAFTANSVGATLTPNNRMVDGEFGDYGISVPTVPGQATPTPAGYPYVTQRITIRNVTAGLRWSKDGPAGPNGTSPVTFDHVLVRVGDQIRIDRNERTYGSVSLFGYGVGIYDLNAIESNSLVAQGVSQPPSYAKLGTQIDLTDGGGDPVTGQGLITFSPDAAVYADAKSDVLTSLSCLSAQGVAAFTARPNGGLEQTATTPPVAVTSLIDNPTLKAIATVFQKAGRPSPMVRFNEIVRYDVTDQKAKIHSYALVSAGEYGVLVLNTDVPGSPVIVDDIWVSNGGAWAIRIIGNHYATAIDGAGETLLIDLSRIDESGAATAPACGSGCPSVFPTLASSLFNVGSGPGFGIDDPRVVWHSASGASNTTLSAVGDPDTGFFFGGTIEGAYVRADVGTDPQVTLKANLAAGLTAITSVVPLGIQPAQTVTDPIAKLAPCGTSGLDVQQPTPCQENASPGVFRIEMSLPGSMSGTSSLPGTVDMAIESERVIDGMAEQTPDPFPPSHLRQFRPPAGATPAQPENRSTKFSLHRILDDSATSGSQKYLRMQSGFNRYVSPWIVAVADPRASSQYTWSPNDAATRDASGCFQCTVPPFLASPASARQLNQDYFELYTLGRYITVRPEVDSGGVSSFGATNYKFLGDRHRVFARFGTVPADTVRPAQALVAAQAPPVATGKIQETVYLHSGEVETSSVDLTAGGRAGWNVAFDRAYRSRTLGFTAFGAGWDSSILARLRVLPTGDVEFRDGSGEVWLFTSDGTGSYTGGKGVFLNLVHTEQGWTLIDQKKRITYFDELGRITKAADQFFKPTGEGNAILYGYDQNGRLASVTDPVGRTTKITYGTAQTEEGFVKTLTDWWTTPRTVSYDYWPNGSLKEAHLPQFVTQSGTSIQPTRHYDYGTASTGSYSDKIELATNLVKIVDPNEQASGGPPRVTFAYGGNVPRDYVASQTWGSSPGQVTFAFTQGVAPTAQTTDMLGQVRNYTFKMPAAPAATDSKLLCYFNDRPHVESMKEEDIEVASMDYGKLPGTAPSPTSAPVTALPERETKYGYNDDGTLQFANVTGGPQRSFGYQPAGPKLGTVLNTATASGGGSAPTTIGYAFESNTAFVKALEANGQSVNQSEPRRDKLTLTDSNSVTTDSTYDDKGRPIQFVSHGGSGTCSGDCSAATSIHYPAETASTASHLRGLQDFSYDGKNSDVPTHYEYPSETETKITDARGVITDTTFDAWHRPIDVKVTMPGDPLEIENQYDYDANGQLHEHRRLQGGQWVKVTYDYDPLGRTKSVTTDHLSTDGTSTVESYDYSNYASDVVKHFVDKAETDVTLDRLGRAKRTETVTGTASNLVKVRTYDIADNTVYVSDALNFATAMAYDASRRRTDVMSADGSSEHVDLDGFGRATTEMRKASDGSVVFSRAVTYQPDGQVEQVTESGGGSSLTTTRAWDGGGRTAGVSALGSGDGKTRATLQEYDTAGRILTSKSGTGTATSVNPIAETDWLDYGNQYLASTMLAKENQQNPGLQTYRSTTQFDAAGNPKNVNLGGLAWNFSYDQDGNAVTEQEPARGTRAMNYNVDGALTTEILADGSQQSHEYYANGGEKKFNDPTGEATSVQTDNLGRPLVVTYADATTEQFDYAGSHVVASKDRQGRWQSIYYEGGHAKEVWASETPRDGVPEHLLEKIERDSAGRVVHWTNADARIDFDTFTLDSLPQHTRQTRFKNHSGLSAAPVELDHFDQTHGYSGHRQRISYSVPGGGAAGWSSNVTVVYDTMGNIQSLTSDGGLTLAGDYRAPGRPNSRSITLPTTDGTSKTLLRAYSYLPDTGQIQEMKDSIIDNASGGTTTDVAGAHVQYEGLQVTDAQLLGVSSNQRHSSYSYDVRSRLRGSVVAASGYVPAPPPGATPVAPGASGQTPDAADFLLSQPRAAMLDATTKSLMQQRGVDLTKVDPPGQTATPAPGHKIDTVTSGPDTFAFDFGGASELADDGLLHYHYDAQGRLDWVAEKATAAGSAIRRIFYTYGPGNRLVGRTAQAADLTTLPVDYDHLTWNVETRQQFIAADGLPAEITFVWDPISDRIITVARAGNSLVANDPNNNTLKQIIHGDMGYDDPVEVTTIDTSVLVGPNQGQPVTKLYPIYDEAASGTLQVVVNRNGQVTARSVNNDAFGGAEFDLGGAGIDHIEVRTTKDASGALDSVTVTMRATELLAAATVAAGARLAVVDANGGLVRTAAVPAALDTNDFYTVSWTLTAAEWAALSDPTAVNGRAPVSLSIAVTTTLRAALWKLDVPILPPPDWATASKPVFTSSSLPFEVRESLSDVASVIASLNPGQSKTSVVYDIPNLGLLGTTEGGVTEIETLLASTFQAQPFAEPFSRKSYVRERWYDPLTSTWLTPDPAGYVDSANLYSFAGGDPVNGRDPTGQYESDMHFHMTYFLAMTAGFSQTKARLIADACEAPDQDDREPKMNGAKMVGGFLAADEPDAAAAAEKLRKWHFPKESAWTGEVIPDSKWATELAFAALVRGNLRDFGEGLHPLQDSWSHAGTPSLGAGGHPGPLVGTESGLMSHTADHTATNPSYALEAAYVTFQFMENYRDSWPRQLGPGNTKPLAWKVVRNDVLQYMRYDTIAEKQQWLMTQNAFIDIYWEDCTIDPSQEWRREQIREEESFRKRQDEQNRRLANQRWDRR